MSEQFKPLAEQTGERMANLLNDNRSIFTKPMKEDGTSQFVMPINARTKQRYSGAAALVLLMQNRRDPRWLSYDQARFNKTPVRKGAYGTLIEFASTNDLRQKMENGQPVMKENGQPKMERVKLDEPVTVQVFMFNGKDLQGLKNGEVKTNPLTPIERAQLIIENSQVNILKEEGWKTHYNPSTVFIYAAEEHEFEKPELYYAAVLHELAHWTGHESRLNRPLTDSPAPDQLAREELRANIASILISAQLNLPYDLGHHESYLKDWAKLLKEEPQELFKAANDAQKIADYVTGLEKNREVKQEKDTKQTQSAGKFAEGMEIDYNNTTYKVLQKQSKGAFKIEDMTTHEKIKITPSNGLYKSLLNQLNNPGQSRAVETGREHEQEHEEDMVEAESEEQTQTRSRRR